MSDLYEGLRLTNLSKRCPRCNAVADVYVDPQWRMFVFRWRKDGADWARDTGCTGRDLLDNSFGCGYDGPNAEERRDMARSITF